jgi:hypothetical protein
MYPTCPSRSTPVRAAGDIEDVLISSVKDLLTPLTTPAMPTPMMSSPAATTSTRPPGQASTPVVTCSWDWELDEPEPSATNAR